MRQRCVEWRVDMFDSFERDHQVVWRRGDVIKEVGATKHHLRNERPSVCD